MGCIEALEKERNTTPAGLPVIIVSAAAIIDSDGRVLVSQRPEGKEMAGFWEFPGGKVEEGESPEFALCREIEEELGLQTRECCFTPVCFASHAYEKFHLLMPLFACRMWKGEVSPKEGQAVKWLYPKDMYDIPMLPADVPLIDRLEQFLL